MSESSAFVLPKHEYKRDIDVLKHYVEQTAFYLHKQFSRPLQECIEFVKQNLRKGGQFEFKDPKITYLKRQDNGDRQKEESTLTQYLYGAIKEELLIAPTLTTYLPETKHPSFLGKFIGVNVKARGTAKKAQFAAEAIAENSTDEEEIKFNKIVAAIKKIEQTNRKLANNAISGAHVSPSNPLYNKSAHSTLTSNCRSTSGYGNANNEKFLCGNRHYWSHHVVLNNIISIITYLDSNSLKEVLDKYAIHYPSVKETMECITYSTNLYWRSPFYLQKIEDLVKTLTPIERAAFVYIGDMYHLKKHNPELVYNFIKRLSTKVTSQHPSALEAIKGVNEAIINHAHQVCQAETRGIGKDYKKIAGTQAIHTLASTAKNIEKTVEDYSDLIRALWVTKNMPASVAYFPSSVRRCAITSDTDSTIFTVQDWVTWYKKKLSFDEEAMGVASCMIYLASSTITHILAMMSANFGIMTDRIHQVEMKNEFKFDVFVATQLGKHYYANMSCQEGNVFTKHKLEIKGVYLKSSNAPVSITKRATNMMESIMNDVMNESSVSLNKYIKYVSDIEKEITQSILKGESTYLRTGIIKDASSYTKSATESPYANHFFWNEVFGPTYGTMPEPPYDTLKISVNTNSPTLFKTWLNSIEDKEFAQRLLKYMQTNNKPYLTTLHLPVQILAEKGFPKEIIPIVDIRKIVSDICRIYYLILETLGLYLHEDKVARLVCDFY